jgi:hypothetical protein
MSTEIVNYQDRLAAMAKKATEVERPVGATIGTRAGILTYGGSPIPGNKLDCIIIASTHANAYYEGKFDPDNISSPACYAYGEEETDMRPHPTAAKPQAESCAECPMNKWGSGTRDGVPTKGKACKNSRSLALIPANTKPEEIADAEVAILKLPVMSVGNFSQYVGKVAALANRPPLGVVTTIGTVPDVKSQFKVTFAMGANVSDEMLPGLFDREPMARTSLERIYTPSEAAPAPKSTSKKF